MARIYGYSDSEKTYLDNFPKQVRQIDDISPVYQQLKQEYHSADGILTWFKRWQKKRQINQIIRAKKKYKHHYKGAIGETKVIEELSQLPNHYHVLCGVKITLPYFIKYDGKKNLKSAQMDFVVVCKKGIYMIEVKNWHPEFAKNHNGFSPYEQTHRAGRILWVYLQSWNSKAKVANVLLSINHGTFQYTEKYRHVLVTSLDRLAYFLENKPDILSDKQIKRTVKRLKGKVTK
ncbi:MAG: hypothetical protein GWN01_08490 [Nitrosopumilaceae archaeon]|nr:NERD domain-containing protein [Nitrosopumilaceae archaeon]NIU00952.1 NERD domain-containing protein [Nitrosopumilaceae archaeon]NIU87410.1 hypothetical protein [Nitrosopumilaceae archaeon]NIV65932.1 hypothetical protein [Nitrosopumilaceae archaeon]NIX61554.1 hypothetical protein [Nitrosopumilaceae archaeon]